MGTIISVGNGEKILTVFQQDAVEPAALGVGLSTVELVALVKEDALVTEALQSLTSTLPRQHRQDWR